MEKKEKIIISATTLVTSLLCYSYARAARKEAVPYVMVGAFLGTLIGEALAEQMNEPANKSISNRTEKT